MALPLVGSYSGPTSVILPKQLRFLIGSSMENEENNFVLTTFGELLEYFVNIDRNANGECFQK